MPSVPCSVEVQDYPCEDCGAFGACKFTKEEPTEKKGMSLEESRLALDDADRLRPLGRTWDWIEKMQGGKLNRGKEA